jgi:PAS domain-containing protein
MNYCGGLTIAAPEAKYIPQIAKRTIVSDEALSVLVPIMEEIVRYEPSQVRALFEEHVFLIQEWDKVRADWLTIRESAPSGQAISRWLRRRDGSTRHVKSCGFGWFQTGRDAAMAAFEQEMRDVKTKGSDRDR